MPFEKAKLMEIDADESARTVPGTEIPVQFNPASLKLALANKVEAQETRGQQTRQYLGKTSTTLSPSTWSSIRATRAANGLAGVGADAHVGHRAVRSPQG